MRIVMSPYLARCHARRLETTKLLLEPLYRLLTNISFHLSQGTPWSMLFHWADPQLSHQLSKVRVLLETALLPPDGSPPGPWAAVSRQLQCDGPQTTPPKAGEPCGMDLEGADEGTSGVSAAGSVDPVSSSLPASSHAGAGTALQLTTSSPCSMGGLPDPLMQLLLAELWPPLAAVCEAGAHGRFLHALAKVCVAVLRCEIVTLTQDARLAMLRLCGSCFVRPGGAALGEPLAVMLEGWTAGTGGLSGEGGIAMLQVRGRSCKPTGLRMDLSSPFLSALGSQRVSYV